MAIGRVEIVADAQVAASAATPAPFERGRWQIDQLARYVLWTGDDGDWRINEVYSDTLALGPAGLGDTEDLSLFNGGLIDVLGNPAQFAVVRLLMVENDSDDTVIVGGYPGIHVWADWVYGGNDAVRVPPRGVLFLVSPRGRNYRVRADQDILRIKNAGATSAAVTVTIAGYSVGN